MLKFDGKESFLLSSSNTGARLHQHMVCKLAKRQIEWEVASSILPISWRIAYNILRSQSRK